MQVVNIKVVHIGEDHATVEMSTVSSSPHHLMWDVPKPVGEWLKEKGAYDGNS